ncbi:hypothetical protein HPB47_026747 [Ixodes persulcatus]|uniref:Uncharacterized protein n=1 Tax=Ixodes persulcatus TaxID=34615 RepID=A0AC60PXS9_IXOPE|nr:hypothetical protein HPB47_026747 [Ixodes persulcatus]
MATGTPSLTASQKTPTERYSVPPSTCGSSIAELENEASITNLAEVRAPDHICGLKVRAYEPVPRHFAVGVIKGVDTSLSDAEVEQHVRSPEGRVARIRQLGQSSIVKIAFSETTLPSFVCLGHVRHPVIPFKERSIQCRKCCGYGHREANCKRPPFCSRCGEAHDGNDTCSGQEKCANCSRAHAATSSFCPKWQRESETRSYARKHAVDFRATRSAVLQQRETTQTAEIEQRPLHSQNTINETSNKQNPSAHGYAAALKKNQQKLMEGALPSNDRKTQVSEPKGEKERPSTSAAATPDPMRKTTSISDAPPIKGNTWESWIPLLKKAARMAYILLSSVDAQWARNITSLLNMILPLMGKL